MATKIDWQTHIGRRLRLRDLHVFLAVAQHGSMARAAVHLGVSQPAVSDVIGNLEHAIGVALFDRGPQGVELTMYGHSLLQRSVAAFDELKQGVQEIEFLADPSAGELRVGCVESLTYNVVTPVAQEFLQQHPNVVLHIDPLVTPRLAPQRLRGRSLDIVVARIAGQGLEDTDDLNLDVLFEDHVVVCAKKNSKWAKRQNIDIAELINEPWALLTSDAWNNNVLAEALRARGLEMPKISVVTFSIHLRASLVANNSFISSFPSSVLRFGAVQYPLSAIAALPIDLPVRPWPVAVMTLKNRTLSPVARLFIEHLHTFADSMAKELKRKPLIQRLTR